jgi:hypothetical protein
MAKAAYKKERGKKEGLCSLALPYIYKICGLSIFPFCPSAPRASQ